MVRTFRQREDQPSPKGVYMIPQSRFSANDFHLHAGPAIPQPATVPAKWDAMVEAEPRLARVVCRARRFRRMRHRWTRYEEFKREAGFLVGWFARDKRLRTSAHWEVFIGRLSEALGV